MIIHTVKKNETLASIGAEYCISPRMLAAQNGLFEGDRLYEGEELAVIIPTRTATVRRGESLTALAQRYGTDRKELIALNPELKGGDGIYYGQHLAVKKELFCYGTAAINGYLYRGCKKERLLSALPYLCLVTMCAALYDGEEFRFIMSEGDVLELLKRKNKGALLRVYLEKLPKEGKIQDFINSLVLYLGAHGYIGATLSVPKEKYEAGAFCELMLSLKKRLMELDMLLFTECEAEGNTSHADYADGCVIYYDKINKENIPTFIEGERRLIESFSADRQCPNAYIDLSPFAYYSDRFITEEEARTLLIRRCEGLSYDEERKIVKCESAGRRGLPLIMESLYSTLEKIRLISELALGGVSLDIGRTSAKKYMLLNSAFALSSDISLMCGVNKE